MTDPTRSRLNVTPAEKAQMERALGILEWMDRHSGSSITQHYIAAKIAEAVAEQAERDARLC